MDSPLLAKYDSFPFGYTKENSNILYLASVADQDKSSKFKNEKNKAKWRSYLQCIKLCVDYGNYQTCKKSNTLSTFKMDIEFIKFPFLNQESDEKKENKDNQENKENKDETAAILEGGLSADGRGMELSELVHFKDKLLTFDDRTGLIYEIPKQLNLIPRFIINEGNGNATKGMKIEWATTKDDLLYVGSIGREFTDDNGKIVNAARLWVATLDINTKINNKSVETSTIKRYADWTKYYTLLREATGTRNPGYVWIEAIEWSKIHQRWFILPRYLSFVKYDPSTEGTFGSNLLLSLKSDFTDIRLVWLKDLNTKESLLKRNANDKFKDLEYSDRGFSTFTFLPNTKDSIIIGVRTKETTDKDGNAILNSWISVFDIDGNVLRKNIKFPGNFKYEGITII